ncbi:MAG: TonB-dependent receptor [Acidobacteria bacterium]|nr:TonB-dependent receptor [Acidobacteriota bacterium]
MLCRSMPSDSKLHPAWLGPIHRVSTLLLVIAVSQQLGFSQMAQITGRTTDSSQAALPGVAITLTNEQTGVTFHTTSNEVGYYTLSLLRPGTYRIELTAPGFRRMSRSGIRLDVEQVAQLDFQLPVGEVTESVEVVAAAPLLETSRATVGQVIENKRVVDLPLNGRNPFELAALSPGVTPVTNWGTPQLGGGRNATSEVQLDGVSNTAPENNVGINSIVYTPQVDSVQEFKVELNALSAEYGRFSGGVINVVTKSGTNQLHGSAYWFLRNNVLDANNFFANRAGRKRSGFKRNQFGGTAGGPIIKDRTFWFAGFEGTRARTQSVFTGTVPADAWRQGNFSGLQDAAGRPITIYDPTSVRQEGNQFVRSPFPNNVIPRDRINNVANNVIRYYPQPNTAPTNPYTYANNYVRSGSSLSDNNRFDSRADHNFSSNWRTFLRYSTSWSRGRPFVPWDNEGAPVGGQGNGRTHSVAFDNAYVISPSLIANVRYGFGRNGSRGRNMSDGFDITQLGFPASYHDQAALNGLNFPRFDMGGTTSNLGANDWTRITNIVMNHVISSSLTKQMRSHNLKFGGEWRKLFVNFEQHGQPSGGFRFSRGWTQREITTANNLQGFPLASFLLGLGQSADMSHTIASATASTYWAFYVQDDWRVTNRLTLNLGLRYDVDIPRTERFNRLSYFDLDARSPIAPLVTASPLCPSCADLRGAMRFVTSDNRRQTPTDTNNFGPRFGLSYQLTGSTVVRAGYGIAYMPSVMQAAGTTGTSGMQGFTSTTSGNFTFDNMRTINTRLDNPFKDGFRLPPGHAGADATDLGFGIGASLFDNYVSSMIQQWNLNIQQQLPGDILIEIGYLGNRGTQLPDGDGGRSYSQLPPSFMSRGPALLDRVDNPFLGVITDPTSSLSLRQVNRNQLLRPFPQYTGVGSSRKPGADSIYHGMTLRAEKRFSQGVSFLVAYTASKLMDDASSTVGWLGPIAGSRLDNYNRRLEWSVSSMDVSQRFVTSWVYELPFGKGKPLGSRVSGIGDFLLSGWQTNGILTLSRGTPIFISGVPNNTNIFSGQRAVNNGRSAHISGGTTDSRINQWFDTSVFSIPAPFTFGNVGRTLPDVRNPGVRNIDLSFFKNYSIRERFTVQYRVEMFNALNTPQFQAPNNSITSSNFG